MRSQAKAPTAGSTQRLALPTAAFAALVAAFSLILGVGSAIAVVPTIPSTGVSTVTVKSARLEAEINPQGEPTTYRFEYGLADCASNPCTGTASASAGSGGAAVKVSEEIAGLAPGTTYHFRAVATNGSGAVEGPDRTFTTYASAAASGDCPNHAFRVGASANLPDCRAYEMVSPVDKNGGEIALAFFSSPPGQGYFQSTPSGEKLAYSSPTSFGDQVSAQNVNQYIATRGPQGWSSHGINPPLTPATIRYPFISPYALHRHYQAFSEDLSSGWLFNDNDPPLTSEGAEGFNNLYRWHSQSGSFEALTVNQPLQYAGFRTEELGMELEFKGASANGSQTVYEATAALTPDAATVPVGGFVRRQIYAFSGGELHLVSVLPDGTANPNGSAVGQHIEAYGYEDTVDRAVSEDGSRIVWTAPDGLGTIYVRVNPTQPQSAFGSGGECIEPAKACTLPISESVTTGRSQFWTASADGSKVLFQVSEGPLLGDLYEFSADTDTSRLIAGEVGDAKSIQISRGVVGASEDLTYIYFTSKEALEGGAIAGKHNLYVDHEGTIDFIATLSATDVSEGLEAPSLADPKPYLRNSRVTPDGRHLAFMSSESLTGYDNTDAVGAGPLSANGDADLEVFRYDADAGQLTCASCNPSGVRPVGKPLVRPFAYSDSSTEMGNLKEVWAAAWIPTWEHEHNPSRVLSDDGSRLFFNSFDALVPEDTNGTQDVYQWEEQGTGSCETAGGCISLISTGQSSEKSEFIEASADGNDVFIRTKSSIDSSDPDLYDLYVAKVGGGYPAPTSPPECQGDACQSIPLAPNDPTAASAGFRGASSPPAKKPRKRCNSRKRNSGKSKASKQTKKKAKRCKRAKRRAKR